MLTGRGTLSGSAPLVAPKAQGMVSSPQITFPAPISFSHFLDGWKQTGRRGRRVKGARLCAFIEAQRRPLTRLPRPVQSPSGKRGDRSLVLLLLLPLPLRPRNHPPPRRFAPPATVPRWKVPTQ
jgi:hypothetical protein